MTKISCSIPGVALLKVLYKAVLTLPIIFDSMLVSLPRLQRHGFSLRTDGLREDLFYGRGLYRRPRERPFGRSHSAGHHAAFPRAEAESGVALRFESLLLGGKFLFEAKRMPALCHTPAYSGVLDFWGEFEEGCNSLTALRSSNGLGIGTVKKSWVDWLSEWGPEQRIGFRTEENIRSSGLNGVILGAP